MNRAIKLTGLLAAALLIGACEHKTDDISDYNPALDGPTLPPSPVIASALLDGKAGGGEIKQPTTPRPATTPAETPATATAPSDTPTTSPAENPATASAGSAADAVKAEIDARMDQAKQLLADGKFEEYERTSAAPDEWQARIAADPDALKKAAEGDKADPVAEAKNIATVEAVVKPSKPVLSADGTLATYRPSDPAQSPVVFKKTDGVWYYSPVESKKASTPPVPAPPTP